MQTVLAEFTHSDESYFEKRSRLFKHILTVTASKKRLFFKSLISTRNFQRVRYRIVVLFFVQLFYSSSKKKSHLSNSQRLEKLLFKPLFFARNFQRTCSYNQLFYFSFYFSYSWSILFLKKIALILILFQPWKKTTFRVTIFLMKFST